MLLDDFDEIDKQLVDAKLLYKNLARYKEIEAIEFLDDEQKELVQRFWNSVDLKGKGESWARFWEKLGLVYQRLSNELRKERAGHIGLLYREMATSVEKYCNTEYDQIIFAGFNALTKSEETIIKYFLENTSSSIHWDFDKAYMEDDHEAGRFLREYAKRPWFEKGLLSPFPDNLLTRKKNIMTAGTSTWVGQARLMALKLQEWAGKPGWKEGATVVVLPDEKLLLPVLNSIPEEIQDINVTMGLPLKYTGPYGFFAALLQMQKNRREGKEGRTFYFKDVIRVLRHPLLRSLAPEKVEKAVFNIHSSKLFQVPVEKVSTIHPVVEKVFYSQSGNHAADLADVALALFELTDDIAEKIYLNAFYHSLSKLGEVISGFEAPLSIPSFIRLYRQMSATARAPFSGEPIKGLQIMGVFETRNLDFENVIVLSMNEDYFPASGTSQSFIPYALRKAYGLSVFDETQSMQAYLFYRLLQRARNVLLLYNSGGDVMGGEQSRFLQQLKYRFPLEISEAASVDRIGITFPEPIGFERDGEIDKLLSRYHSDDENSRSLSPSALNNFIDCRLKFYYKYIARIKEPEEAVEEIGPMEFGNIFHRTLELAYLGKKEVVLNDIKGAIKELAGFVDQAFQEVFGSEDRIYQYQGQHVIVREIVFKLAKEVLSKDMKRAPFEILGLELGGKQEHYCYDIKGADGKELSVRLGGVIDRVDNKDGIVRIADYKTGKDERDFRDVASLFDRELPRRNKAAFQVMYYCWLYKKKYDPNANRLQPGIYNARGLYSEGFSTKLSMLNGPSGKKEALEDVGPLLGEFEEKLKELLEDIFFTEKYDQTSLGDACKYCAYRKICFGFS